MSRNQSKDVEAQPTPGVIVNDDPHPDPFAGNSVRVRVTRRIDVGQLQEEITARTRVQAQVVLSPDDPSHIASESAPAILFVSPSTINERVIRDVVSQHVPRAPKPAAGADPASGPQPFDADSLPEDLQPLVTKLRDGKDLKVSEASDLLRGILGIAGA